MRGRTVTSSWRSAAARAIGLAALLLLAGCAGISPREQAEVDRIVGAARPTGLDCERDDRCAHSSALLAMADADRAGQHHALIIDHGQDALLARIHLIRAARERIDLQTYIYDDDDSARLVLRELIAAARRGVKVRVLMDQLTAMKSARTLAALAGVHANFEAKLYNPVLDRGYLRYSDYLLAGLCCFRQLNQRMHSKLLLVDDRVGITGGRNYQDDYYDWDSDYNFRDRDLLMTGPVTADMRDNFEAFWRSRRSVPVEQLRDVAAIIRREGVPEISRRAYSHPERARLMQADANDAALLEQRLVAPAMPVSGVSFVADLPQKHRDDAPASGASAAPSTSALRELVEGTQEELLMQTPYLVFSDHAQDMFTRMHDRPHPPRVVVSTNSLAATDAFMVYALSHKYKRRYLRRFGFEIYEYKPYPGDAPIDLAATRAIDGVVPEEAPAQQRTDGRKEAGETREAREYTLRRRWVGRAGSKTATLERNGLRIGLHAKSLVIDEGIGVVGTHNFDPRGDHYNTESAVIIRDPAFARALARSIRRDIQPENAWVIAPRVRTPVFSRFNYNLLRISENLPVFDLVLLRYATSYDFVPGPGCPAPLTIHDQDFQRCYRPVGDFPEVRIGPKGFATRVLTAFGAGLAPIL